MYDILLLFMWVSYVIIVSLLLDLTSSSSRVILYSKNIILFRTVITQNRPDPVSSGAKDGEGRARNGGGNSMTPSKTLLNTNF